MKQKSLIFCIIIILFIFFCIYCSHILNKVNDIEGFQPFTDTNILTNFSTINGQPTNKSIIANEIVTGINNHEKLLNIYNNENCDPFLIDNNGLPINSTNNTCANYAGCMPTETKQCAINEPLAYFKIYTENDKVLMNNVTDPPKSYLLFALNILPYLVGHDKKIKNAYNHYNPYPNINDIEELINQIFNNYDQTRKYPCTEVYVLWYLVDYVRYQDYYITENIIKSKTDEIINIYKK